MFVIGKGRYLTICVVGLSFAPKDKKTIETIILAKILPGRDITSSLVDHLSGVLLLGRTDMAQYMFGAIFTPKDKNPIDT